MSTLLYFAYGSNMLWQRIAQRVPSARPFGRAQLHGHALRWHKAGRDGSGKCDIVPSAAAGAVVFGVVYELAVAEKPLLDAAEGLGMGYDEKQVELETAAGSQCAWTYCATSLDDTLLPFGWYQALVVAGALQHGLPDDYVAALRAVAAKDDADAQRTAVHLALLKGR